MRPSREVRAWRQGAVGDRRTAYGATAEIAQAIAETLGGHGLEPTILPPEQAKGGDGDDAVVVVGSAVYADHWLKPARELVERHAGALAGRPV